jgi:hypothetical protein
MLARIAAASAGVFWTGTTALTQEIRIKASWVTAQVAHLSLLPVIRLVAAEWKR